MKTFEQFADLDPYGEENWSDKAPIRHIAVSIFDRNSSANFSGRIVFTNDAVEMENRLNAIMEESGFSKYYFECETRDQFTMDEIEMLEGIGIEIY